MMALRISVLPLLLGVFCAFVLYAVVDHFHLVQLGFFLVCCVIDRCLNEIRVFKQQSGIPNSLYCGRDRQALSS